MVAFRFQGRDMVKNRMRNLLAAVICIAFSCSILPSQNAVPLPELNSKRLLNDLQIIVATTPNPVEDMTIGLVVRYGAIFDPTVPVDKSGLANLLSRMFMRATVDRRLKEIQADLASLGATLEVQCDWDCYRLIMKGQSSKFERSLLLLYQVVCEAQFIEEDLASVKQKVLQEIQNPPDPRRRIRTQFEKNLFSGIAYGRPLEGTPKSLGAITVGDVRYFYRKYFTPNEASLIVVGNVSGSLVLQKASRIWGAWVRNDQAPFTFRPPSFPKGKQVFLEDDPGSTATQFIVGSLFPRRDDPAYPHALLAAQILQERLTKLLPTSLLTVGEEGRRMAGPLFVQGQAAAEQAVEQIKIIQDAADAMKASLVSDDELVSARKKLIGEFNSQLGKSEGICRIMLDSELYRLGSNYAVSYPDRIRKCDAEAIKRAANSWILPGGAILLLRGPAAILKPTMEHLGSYKQILP
jgi:zinc protease